MARYMLLSRLAFPYRAYLVLDIYCVIQYNFNKFLEHSCLEGKKLSLCYNEGRILVLLMTTLARSCNTRYLGHFYSYFIVLNFLNPLFRYNKEGVPKEVVFIH